MKAPNMASITDLLDNFSLNHCGEEDDVEVTDGVGGVNLNVDYSCAWERCIDLKIDEICYSDWSALGFGEEASYNGDDDSSDDSSVYSRSSFSDSTQTEDYEQDDLEGEVLVVAGCRGCMMYCMMPRKTVQCPKCSSVLLHFDGQENLYI